MATASVPVASAWSPIATCEPRPLAVAVAPMATGEVPWPVLVPMACAPWPIAIAPFCSAVFEVPAVALPIAIAPETVELPVAVAPLPTATA